MAENDQEETIPEIRKKLEDALANLKTVSDENVTLKQQSAIKDSKLELTPRQQAVVLRDLADSKTELTAESYKEVAQELGFGQTQTPPPNDSQQNSNGNQPPTSSAPDPNPDNADDIMVSLAEMSTIDRANYHARRGNVNKDLDTLMNEAKSPEELTSIIRKHGPASGLVHEWDTE